ncbi:YjcZ family sporulation protein [Lentibacillus cibarius]|uniref:YjcZ family sporulation protein n=1 Tax=Lentibacillus cibarius TaxID=2583219 RepID=A0A549YK12_9BACI|nr:YjcZ family sporulation protein [Lentibacillus cibarius]TRM12194.1 YjcZ family sporulation protein [Lentibacillus cibarius]
MSYAGGYGNNGFVLFVVLFILLIIVGSSYTMGGGYGY